MTEQSVLLIIGSDERENKIEKSKNEDKKTHGGEQMETQNSRYIKEKDLGIFLEPLIQLLIVNLKKGKIIHF